MISETKPNSSNSCYSRLEGPDGQGKTGQLHLPNGSQLVVSQSAGEGSRILEEARVYPDAHPKLSSKDVCILDSKAEFLEGSREPPSNTLKPSKSILKKASPSIGSVRKQLSTCQKFLAFITCGIALCFFSQKEEEEPLLSGSVSSHAPPKRVRFNGPQQAPNMLTKRPIQNRFSSRDLSLKGQSLRVKDLPYTLSIDKTPVSSEDFLSKSLSHLIEAEVMPVAQHYLAQLSSSAPSTASQHEKEELHYAGMHLETLPESHQVELAQFSRIQGDQEVTVYRLDSKRTVAVCNRDDVIQKTYNWREQVCFFSKDGEVRVEVVRVTEQVKESS